MRLVLGDGRTSPLIAAWVADHIQHMESAADFGPCMAMMVVSSQNEPLCGAVYHNWRPRFRDIEISFASASVRCLTRDTIKGILSYPFAQLQCGRVTAITPRRATSARRFLEKFGFKREGVARKGFGTDDAIIYGLLAKEWAASPWVAGLRDGKVRSSTASRARPECGVGGADQVEQRDGALSEPTQ